MLFSYNKLGDVMALKGIVIDPGHPSEIKPSINRTSCSKL